MGREILLINQLQGTIVRENAPLYIARESLKKETNRSEYGSKINPKSY